MAEPVGASPDGTAAPGAEAEPSALRALLLALVVCGVCSAVVTTAVVTLRPFQVANQRAENRAKVAALLSGLEGVSAMLEGSTEAGARRAELAVRVVELGTGEYAPAMDPDALLETPVDEREGSALPAGEDPAGIGWMPRYAPVYELLREGAVETVVLPVHGDGYLATIRGFLAVAGDGNTVRGITFTEHEETPGLGGEIDSDAWQARWRGKELRGPEGEIRIRVVEDAGSSPFRVQGIGGATKTGNGVSEMVRFWVGPRGFGPYLARIAGEDDARRQEEDDA